MNIARSRAPGFRHAMLMTARIFLALLAALFVVMPLHGRPRPFSRVARPAMHSTTATLKQVTSTASTAATTTASNLAARIHSAALRHKLSIAAGNLFPNGAIETVPQPTPLAENNASLQNSTASAAATSTAGLNVTVRRRATMQTPLGYIATAPLNGLTSGSYVMVHGDGAVSANSENGDVIWNHGSLDFTQWTGRYPPYNNGNAIIWNPSVQLLPDPIDPFVEAGEHAFAVGDVNNDGIDDVAVAHYFPAGVNAIAGNGGTLVSVLDGATGNLVWSHMYPGHVNNLAVSNGVLVVASETGDVKGPVGIQIGQNGSVSTLDGWKFDNGAATLTMAWSVSTGVQWARWLALQTMPGNTVAAAWTSSPVGSGNTTAGNELAVSLDSGATLWSVATTGYVRFLRPDSSRNQVVAIEEADPSVAYDYSIIARNLSDGSVATNIAENSATALNFQVGDLDGDGNADYVVSDIAYLPCAPDACLGVQNSGRVLAINPTSAAQEWSQVRSPQPVDPANPISGTDIPRPYGLLLQPAASGADVVVGSFIPGGNMELERLSGAVSLSGPAGTVLWSQSAPNLFFPAFISLYQKNGASLVRAASSRPHYFGGGVSLQLDDLGATLVLDGLTPFDVVRTFDAGTGNQASAVPLLGRIHAVAGTDVNGDGTADLVVGGESNAVFALDGTKIDSSPHVLWRTTVAGPVHQVAAADLAGDGHTEIVVAATHAIDVLDAATGNLRYEIPYAGDFIWNFLVADLQGNGIKDIVVPSSSSLTSYSGATGSIRWTFTPSGGQAPAALFSNVAITPDKIVTAQFAYGTQDPVQRTGGGYSRGLVAVNGATGTVLWTDSNPSTLIQSWFPQFWHGTVAGELDGISGSIVGFSWVGYDYSKDPAGACQSCFTPAMEIRDALTGVVINSLPQPWIYNGSEGTLLLPEKGILSYAGNASWLLGATQSGEALGYDIPWDMQEGNFALLGRRVIEATAGFQLYVFPQNGIDFASWTGPVAHAATYFHTIAPTRAFLQDLDGDGIDEIIRVQFDSDGDNSLVAAIQGFGLEPKPWTDGLDVLELQPSPVAVTGVVSRKTHGSAGTFDIDVTNGGVEARSGGAGGNYTLIFSFSNPLASVDGAAVTNGAGSVSASNVDPNDAHNYIVNLSGVTNAQTISVNLSNVTDSAGNFSPTVMIALSVLVGDVNGNKVVTNADVAATQAQVAAPVTNSNFRNDVNANGVISNGDVSVIQANVGRTLP